MERSFEEFFCYILYSKSINRYYIGYTSNFEERLELHNNGHFGGKSYTSRSSDWELFLLIPCQTIEQAVFVELRIKRMKSRQYIVNLKKHPNLIEEILKDFNK